MSCDSTTVFVRVGMASFTPPLLFHVCEREQLSLSTSSLHLEWRNTHTQTHKHVSVIEKVNLLRSISGKDKLFLNCFMYLIIWLCVKCTDSNSKCNWSMMLSQDNCEGYPSDENVIISGGFGVNSSHHIGSRLSISRCSQPQGTGRLLWMRSVS